MSADTWTIDSIAHALPSAELRQNFLREVHLTPRSELDAVLERWEQVAIRWTEEEAPRIERARTHYAEHGTLPPEYEGEPVEEAQRNFEAWRTRMREQKGSSAA
ncbi:hypothetical protein G5C51_32310 [Streptomyces sp. A7024]|uniref:Uncharacterized protein n=1 Tax=Streptomyces coryli TaxID=1128680 RepID=A0A6G4UB09_9ACTN|nr:hypothetical protein [Streptomyces coryli]NGN68568.1 hypothetical protein [Streptomyces coryli]